jgi:hypothetical protein
MTSVSSQGDQMSLLKFFLITKLIYYFYMYKNMEYFCTFQKTTQKQLPNRQKSCHPVTHILGESHPTLLSISESHLLGRPVTFLLFCWLFWTSDLTYNDLVIFFPSTDLYFLSFFSIHWSLFSFIFFHPPISIFFHIFSIHWSLFSFIFFIHRSPRKKSEPEVLLLLPPCAIKCFCEEQAESGATCGSEP